MTARFNAKVKCMWKKHRVDSVLNLFLILLVAIVVIPVIVAYSVSYSGLVERLHGTYNVLAQVSSDTSTTAIGDALDSVNDVSLAIIGNDRVCSFLTRDPNSKNILDIYSSAYEDVETYRQSNRYIVGIRIDALQDKRTLASAGMNSNYEITDEEKARMRQFQEPWFWTIEANGKVGICRLIRNKNDNYSHIGYLKIILNENSLLGQSYHTRSSDEDRYALIDTRDDRIILASDDDTLKYMEHIFQDNLSEIKYGRHLAIQQDGFYINIRRLGTKNVSVAAISSDQTGFLNSLKYGNILLVCLLFLVTSLVYAVLYRRVIVAPLDALNESMRLPKVGSPAPPLVNVRAWGELRDLVETFNSMSQKLDYLYDTNYKNELKLKDAHLLILQSEINPHFLYNVLDSIHWMIELDEKASASAMVQLLAKSFRVSLQLSNSSVITLDKELDHLNIYIGIEQYRFRERIRFHLNVQSGLEKAQVVKFILQPLVENAIVHGIQKSDTGRGTVVISIYRKGNLLVYDIRDDGVGADSDRIHEILNGKLIKEHSLEGFALENIQSRLTLAYGPAYGISYQPRDGGGSVFTVTQPYISGNGDDTNAEADDRR